MNVRWILLLNLMWPVSVYAQAITGRVLDGESLKPIEGASAYLAHTLWGRATDEHGLFSIESVPEGSYTLIISRVGYDAQRLPIEKPDETGSEALVIHLHRSVYQLGELEVSAEQSAQWEKQSRMFKELFLGTMAFEEDAEIINPYVLDFKEERGSFTAVASEPIYVENKGLGYLITYQLMGFRWDKNLDVLQFIGAGFFEKQEPATPEEAARWQENRKQAYTWLALSHPPQAEQWDTRFMQGTCSCDRYYFGKTDQSTCKCYYEGL